MRGTEKSKHDYPGRERKIRREKEGEEKEVRIQPPIIKAGLEWARRIFRGPRVRCLVVPATKSGGVVRPASLTVDD